MKSRLASSAYFGEGQFVIVYIKRENTVLYAIWASDVPDSLSLRQKNLSVHRERLRFLQDEGRLVIAGPTALIDSDDMPEFGFSGSLIVAEFASLEEAKAWAHADPYLHVGVYKNIEVRPFKQVFPA